MDVADTDAAIISLNSENTVQTLSQKLSENQNLITGFPIIKEDDGVRLQAYIGYDELDAAIRAFKTQAPLQEPPTPCSFRDLSPRVNLSDADAEATGEVSPDKVLDLGYLTDRAPVSISSRAPLQLVHQLFIRLGVRYLAVQDERGCYVGIIEKNRWVESQYLRNLTS